MQYFTSVELILTMFGAAVFALGVSLIATPFAARWASKAGVLAIPRARDVHDTPVPRWGGLPIFLGFFLTVGLSALLLPILHAPLGTRTLFDGAGIVLGGAIISFVGALDDRKELSPLPRLFAQAGASLVAYACGVRIETLTLPFSHHSINTHWLSAPITIFWMMLVMNAINWIDGLDGLAAGTCSIIAAFLAVIALATQQVCLALLCVALAGSAVGFLWYNRSPARIYMGGGAEFLGFVLAAVSVAGAFKQVTTVAIVLPVMAMAVPLIDSVHVVLRRAASGVSVYQADRRHFHHALLDMGLSKTQAVLVLYLLTLLLCLCAWFLFKRSPVPIRASRHSLSVSETQRQSRLFRSQPWDRASRDP